MATNLNSSDEDLNQSEQEMIATQYIQVQHPSDNPKQQYPKHYWDRRNKLFYDQQTQSNLQFICRRQLLLGNRLDWFARSMIFFQYGLGTAFALTFVLSYLQEHSQVSLLAFPALTCSISVFNSVLVCIKDPGIIDRNRPSQIDYQKYQTIEDDRLFFDKYCVTCKINRPPTASHCGYCNVCVYGFDHHCFFYGTCIGIRNWRNFVLSIVFVAITTLYFSILNFYIFIQLAMKTPSYQKYFSIELEQFMYILVISIVVLIMLCLWSSVHLRNQLFICTVIGGTIFMINISFEQNYRQYYDNPIFYLLYELQLIAVLINASVQMVQGCVTALEFKTQKQRSVINEYFSKKKNRHLYDKKYNGFRKIEFRQIISNIQQFMKYEYPPSQIFKETECMGYLV